MDWKQLLAYMTGSVDQELLLRNEHLVTENRILRQQITSRIYLYAYAEHWVRSVKDEALSRMILFGERSLQHVLKAYVTHFHHERPHQGKGNVVLMPVPRHEPTQAGTLQCRERLGGLLMYYYRDAT